MMTKIMKIAVLSVLLLSAFAMRAWGGSMPVGAYDGVLASIVGSLEQRGFSNIRASESPERVVLALECDSYKIPSEGFAVACALVRDILGDDGRVIKIIGLNIGVPEVTMTYDPGNGTWSTTRRLDDSWDEVRSQPRVASSVGKTDILIYPQVSLKNLIINQVYQSLWQLSPALEVSLWPGMKFTYQLKLPVYNDGYGQLESKIHPGMISLSQRFRDPWHLNINGKLTLGYFSNNRYGAALEMEYWFPDERFWVDTQLAYLGNSYWDGFIFRYDRSMYFRWNVAFNCYIPMIDTQFILRAQRFLLGDIGLKYEMIRHFNRCSVGLYAEKSRYVDMNVGFRFQIALPPYRHARNGYRPRVSLSRQMGMSYNANNEQYYYKEFRTEASDNIMSRNYFNPCYINSYLR